MRKNFKRIISLVIVLCLSVGAFTVSIFARELADLDVKNETSLNDSGYAENIQNINVHTAEEDGYHFLLGASIIKFGDIWVCSYGQSKVIENDETTRFACKYSYDNCLTWSEEYVIADVDSEGYGRGHGVLYSDGTNLYAICPRAEYDGTAAFEYIDFKMELYSLNTQNMQWKYEATVMEDDFWPLCEPIALANGDILIAGLECESGKDQAAVAIAKNGDLTNFERVIIPNENKISMWGESTVIDYGNKLVLFARTNKGYAGVSESYDYGRSWSSLVLSDLEFSSSKMYGGALSTGQKYLIYNPPTSSYRSTLAITVGDYDGSYGFGNVYTIKSGYEKESQFGFARQWAYPYAVEEDGYLYVVYSENKEDCELSIIPISSLAYSETTFVDVSDGEYIQNLNGAPKYEVLAELVDVNDKVWWSGDGTDSYIEYTEIDGVPVVARRQSKTSGNQTLRRSFDMNEGDCKNLALMMTFYSAVDFSSMTTVNNGNRAFLGSSTLKSQESDPHVSGSYQINTRSIDYKGSATNLWGEVKAGWNSWIIEFDCASSVELNTFFSIFLGTDAVKNGDILYALSSVKVVRLDDTTAGSIETYYSVPSREAPGYATLKELVDTENDKSWWSGYGENGTNNVLYTTIDGVPVVASVQSSSGNQVLRRMFEYDYSNENYDRLAFEITFWSAIDFSTKETMNSNNRLFFGDCSSLSGENQNFSSDYTTNKASYYRASTENLWCNVKKGWNTLLISYSALGSSKEDLSDFNTFFSVFVHDSGVETGEIVYAISSLKLVRLNENTPYGEIPSTYENKPFLVFKNGVCIGGCDNFVLSGNDNNNSLSVAKTVTDGNAEGEIGSRAYVYVREDATVKALYSNMGQILGTVVIDLNGHKLVQSSTNLFSAQAKYWKGLEDAVIEVKNGSIVLDTKGLFKISAAGDGYAKAADETNYKNFRYIFKNVDFSLKENATLKSFIGDFIDESSMTYCVENMGLFVSFDEECRIDISGAPDGFVLFDANDVPKVAETSAYYDTNSIVTIDMRAQLVSKTNLNVSWNFVNKSNGSSVIWNEKCTLLLTNGANLQVNGEPLKISNGVECVFVMASANGTASTYKLMPKVMAGYKIKTSVTLWSNFVYNIYIPATNFNGVKVNGLAVDYEEVEIDGVVYYHVAVNLPAGETLADIKLTVTLNSGNTTVDANLTLNVYNYTKSVLAGEFDDTTKTLMKDMLVYATAAHTYFDNTAAVAETLAEINTLLGDYTAALPTGEAKQPTTDTYFTKVEVYVGEVPSFRFYLAEGYTADDFTFKVGKRNANVTVGDGYVEIVMYAYMMLDDVTFTVKGTDVSESYNLYSYYAYAKTLGNANLTAVVEALMKYSVSAKAYRDAVVSK